MIIFGSAVHSWHYADSDLDVCIVGNNPDIAADDFSYRKQMKMPGCRYDFVEFPDMATLIQCRNEINSVEYDILTEGVMVYEQGRLVMLKEKATVYLAALEA